MGIFWKKFRNVQWRDIGHIFLFLFAIIPARFVKRQRPHMWLVCEYGEEARDNGYWFFRYMREQNREQDCVYAIDFQADDYERVKNLGECVPYGSFRHWIYYLAAEINISSHKGGKPNAAVCYLFEVYGLLKNKRVFLQHGITKDLAEMFFYENTKMRLFICGAKPEFDYVKANFHYPDGYVAYTGFARFDSLLKPVKQKRQILVVPTWRRWLYTEGSNPYENDCPDIEESEYYRQWKGFLNSSELHELLDKEDFCLTFFPHRNMTSVFEHVTVQSDRVRICTWKDTDLQELMKESACMITDYSSVAMDFAYLKKPLLYFQFDYEEYRIKHFEEGYFDYRRDGFGAVCTNQKELLSGLIKILEDNCEVQKEYEKRIRNFFLFRDENNCKRIEMEIRKICNDK